MKQIVMFILSAAFILSCGNRNANSKIQSAENEKAAVVYSVDDLYTNAGDLVGKEVMVKGTVMHVCKQGGARCFLMGSNEDFNIRVEAGEKIGAFSQEQMGGDLTISGIFKEVKTAADAHNPAREHAAEDHDHDAEAEEAHRIIVQAEERADVVYFIEGLRILNEEF